MIAIDEVRDYIMRMGPKPPCLILLGSNDLLRLAAQVDTVPTQGREPPPTLHGIKLIEDPGLPSGNFELISDEAEARRRIELIKLKLTVTPDGTIKHKDWWRK